MTEHNDQPIKPAEFSPHEPTTAVSPGRGHRPSPLLWSGLAGAVVLVLFVFVLLPSLVNDSPSDPAATNNAPPTGMNDPSRANGQISRPTDTSQDSGSERSPFAEAQLQKQRRAAQEALQKVLELQEILAELAVTEWAPDEYAAAIARAEQGDAAYREREFVNAAAAYQGASEALVILEASIPERAEQAVNAVTAAVEAGDVTTADTQLGLLTTLAPGDGRAVALQQRVNAIPVVASAKLRAADAAAAEDFGAATGAIKEAIAADPANENAQILLAKYQQLDIDARFRQAMSAGYLALEESRFDAADTAFKKAAQLHPGAPEPQAAQVELNTARTAATLRALQSRGLEQERAEHWRDALETYQQALSIDDTVLFARDGVTRAQPRAGLAKALSDILDNTERLVDVRALADAREQLAAAQSIASPGPVLRQQIANVEQALAYASTPVEVSLTSDGLTDITLLRVKRLGTFTSTPLTLRPGSYTAMGVRNGFRDVRVNFDVIPGNSPVIDVRCTEAL